MTRSKKPDTARSVFLERMSSAYEDVAKNRLPNQRLARFAASVAMELGLTVAHVPTSELQSHCEIDIQTRFHCKELARSAELVPFE